MNSVWTDTAVCPEFPPLEGDQKTQVLIIGGGLAGILCAYQLEQAGVEYILVEAERICSGVTKNTTAKITSQHGLIYDKLIQTFGVERARMYFQANEAALKQYRQICRSVECGFETKDSYVYSLDEMKPIERELEALGQIGSHGEYVKSLPLPFPVEGAVRFRMQAQFNPLQLIARIAEGLNIYEKTVVREFIGETVLTNRGRITASKIIVATHFPMLNKHGGYFLKLYQHRSYVLALGHAANVDGMYVDEAQTGLSFRNYRDMLLLGGGGHRTGKRGGGWQELEAFARKYYPSASIRYRWATQDCMSLDGIPYIGPYSKQVPNLFVATGFNKWGMTSSMVAANLLCDLVQEKENPYAQLYSPSRTMLRPQLAINAAETTASLMTISKPRCPHMGCALKWNPQERSWDCPCHGSRFTKEGKLIDNPATGDLNKRPSAQEEHENGSA